MIKLKYFRPEESPAGPADEVARQPPGGIVALTILFNVLGGLAVFATPFFWLAGIMSLAGGGNRGRYFPILGAFFISTMAHPLTYAVCTTVTLMLTKRKRYWQAMAVQSLPIVLPITLGVIGFELAL